jgi:hypothetical protein
MCTAFQCRNCNIGINDLMGVVDVNISRLLEAKIASFKVAINEACGCYCVQHSDSQTERFKSGRK